MAVVSNGTTIIDAGALGSGVATGKMILIKTLTASSSSTLSFLNGADSVVFDDTYNSYAFKFIDIHPATDDQAFTFQVDTGTNTSFNQTITSSFFNAQHSEGDATYLMVRNSGDQGQGTAFQRLTEGTGSDNDQSCCGTLTIHTPADTTFVKHFISQTHNAHHGNYAMNNFIAGYVNTTTALTRVRFKFESGAIASGVIKLYGIGG